MGPDTADGRRPPVAPGGGGGPAPWIIEQARALTAQMDAWDHAPYPDDTSLQLWMGRANAVLKELTRDA